MRIALNAKKSKHVAPIIFISPAVVFLLIFSILPMVYSFWISLQSYNTSKSPDTIHFAGLDNYIAVLTDVNFFQSAGWTFIFTICAVALNVLFGLILAVLLTSHYARSSSKVFKTLFTLPMMIAPIVTATIWKLMFSPIYGVLNGILTSLGLERVDWMSNTLPARIALIIVEVWATTPLCMLILMAALQTVSDDVIEATKIDGANWIQCFIKIILPLIRNHLALVITLRFMDAIRMFDIVYNLTNGGPGTSTETLASTIYKMAFRYFDVGKGSAGAYIFFIMIILLSLLSMKLLSKPDYE